MPATFKVVGTLALRSRKQLVVFGDLLDGEIARGMELSAPAESRESRERLCGRVDSIEYVDFISLRAHYPALVLHSDEVAQIDDWHDTLTEGLVLSLK